MKNQLLSLCLFLLAHLNPSLLNGQCNPTNDSLALVALYNSTNGPGWTNNTNWLVPGQVVATWYGVALNGAGCITSLELIANNLDGIIPPELGELSSLQQLNLASNQLSGAIPAALGNLSSLQLLNLAYNQLSGNIPHELGNLSSLQQLNLASNQLSGAIPAALGNLSSLQLLNLAFNQLSGNIPPELGNLSSLTNLYLNDNNLIGCIPPELQNLCPGVGSNGDVSNNPNLATQSWVNFCLSNEGVCCVSVPFVQAGSGEPVCEGDVLLFFETGSDAIAWSWQGPNGFSSTQQNPFILQATLAATGVYSVTVTASNGCTNSAVIEVSVHPLPQVDLGNDTTLFVSGFYLLDAGAGFTDYFWNDGSTASTLFVTETDDYSVTVTDANGCQNFDEITVQFPNGVAEVLGGGRLVLFPNPAASGEVNLRLEHIPPGTLRVSLCDPFGYEVFSQIVVVEAPIQSLKLLTGTLKKGVYFLHINTEYGGMAVKKLVVD